MSRFENRFELRLSNEHLARLKIITECQNDSNDSAAIRRLIDQAYEKYIVIGQAVMRCR